MVCPFCAHDYSSKPSLRHHLHNACPSRLPGGRSRFPPLGTWKPPPTPDVVAATPAVPAAPAAPALVVPAATATAASTAAASTAATAAAGTAGASSGSPAPQSGSKRPFDGSTTKRALLKTDLPVSATALTADVLTSPLAAASAQARMYQSNNARGSGGSGGGGGGGGNGAGDGDDDHAIGDDEDTDVTPTQSELTLAQQPSSSSQPSKRSVFSPIAVEVRRYLLVSFYISYLYVIFLGFQLPYCFYCSYL